MSGLLPSEKSLVVNSVISEFSLNDFTEKERIGSGGEGEVFRGYNDQLGKVAFKRLYRPVNKIEMSEVILLAKHSNHPNIIRLFGLLTPEKGYSPNNRSFCIGYIMEYMEKGSLFDVIHNTSVKYDMEQVYSWIEMASSGLQYLHKEGIMHRDIKPQNILLGKSLDDLRISDFGLAKVVELQTIASHTGGIGTVDYMAPELHQSQYGKPADIYSLTITFWEIIHRKRPYGYMGQVSPFEQICRILKGDRPKVEKEPEISALLIRGWDNDPESRPKISEFIEFSRKKRPAQENLRKVVSQQNLPTQDEEEFNAPATVINRRTTLPYPKVQDHHKKESFTPQKPIEKKPQPIPKRNIQTQQETVIPKVRLRPLIDVEDLPTNSIEVIVMGGTINGDQTDRIFWLNYRQDETKKRWIQLPIKLPYKVANHCVVNLHGEVYLFGGMDENEQACSFLYKLTDEASWERLKDLNSARFHAACVKLDGKIYAIGGVSGSTVYASVECYDPNTNNWTFIRQMNEARASVAAVVQNEKILVSGGFDQNQRRLTTFEFYDPGSNVWFGLRLNLPLMTSGHSMIQFNNSIYAYGGRDGILLVYPTSVKYTINLALGVAQRCQADNLCQARSNFASVRFGKNLFAIGGWNGKELDSVEIFHQGIWFQYNKLPISIAGLRAVVVTTKMMDKMKEAGNGIDEDEDFNRKLLQLLRAMSH